VAAILAAVLVAAFVQPAIAVDKELKETRQELRETKRRIRARAERTRAIQRKLNRLATRISRNEGVIVRTQHKMHVLAERIDAQEPVLRQLEAELAAQAREAYITGGSGAPLIYLFTATSAAEMASRLSLLDEVSRRDSLLADKVLELQERLANQRAQYARYLGLLRVSRQELKEDQREMNEVLRHSREMFQRLQAHKEAVLYQLSRIRPFLVCPVGNPHAIADDFGIWVHRPKNWGGDHVHQGNDIMAPGGTPIYAPFDGVAVNATNHIGGNAVKVFGKYGYVYNAHLSRFGKLGQVQTGDIVGYVGATGNTGANHDHFEWHPGNGSAVDPHPFLMKVC
jgi:murein DD-endopeptidase MepM/ murein hydrolase activator NlpD